MAETLFQRGERRHEECRFGRLTSGYEGPSLEPGDMKPVILPICMWQVQKPCPPAVDRAWGGNLIEYDRDCAVCDAFQKLEARDG